MRVVKHITTTGGQQHPHDLMYSNPILVRLCKFSNTLDLEPQRARIMKACVIREMKA